jgi:hypothetical protein
MAQVGASVFAPSEADFFDRVSDIGLLAASHKNQHANNREILTGDQ